MVQATCREAKLLEDALRGKMFTNNKHLRFTLACRCNKTLQGGCHQGGRGLRRRGSLTAAGTAL